MPKSLPNREAVPVTLENPAHIGDYIQGGVQEADFYNMFTDSILCGEPMILFDKVGITKRVIGPLECGTVNFGCWMNFLVDPALANPILQGDRVYYSLDLSTSAVPGYVTNIQPTNGIFLGHATIMHEREGNIPLTAVGPLNKAVAASTSALRVPVLMHTDKMVHGTNFWGNVPDFVNGDTVISS